MKRTLEGRKLDLNIIEAERKNKIIIPFEAVILNDSSLEKFLISPEGNAPLLKSICKGGCDKAKNLPLLSGIKKEGGVYSSKFVDCLCCMLNSNFYLANNITLDKVIASGIQGKAILGKIMTSEKNQKKPIDIVIKSSHRNSIDDGIHEIFVCLYGLNKLRERIPNFSCIYGYSLCGESFGRLDNCKSNDWDKNLYIIYERIDGENLFKLIIEKEIDCNTYLNLFLQLLFSLEIASEYCGFTHYDLHSQNMIIKPLINPKGKEEPYYIKYYHNIYLKAKSVLTFIDYGHTAINYSTPLKNSKLLRFGGSDVETKAYYDRSKISPLFDTYKFLCSSYVGASDSNNKKIMVMSLYLLKVIFKVSSPTDVKRRVNNYCGNKDVYSDNRKIVDILSLLLKDTVLGKAIASMITTRYDLEPDIKIWKN